MISTKSFHLDLPIRAMLFTAVALCLGMVTIGSPDLAFAASASSASAGFTHTCAVTATGGVQCWGGNAYGQLGNGSTTNSSTPVAVSGLGSGVAAVAVGYWHTCALTTAGGVQCWGRNDYGQLGDGTTTDRLTPVGVSGLTSGVASVDVAERHSCAVTTTGGVQCWGANFNGYLGDGTTTNSSIPVAVTGLSSGIDRVSLGQAHTCALNTGGGVKCWGRNSDGRLGDGTTTQSLVPVGVVGLSTGASAIGAGWRSTCAVTTSGEAQCWGRNVSGQLGDGTTTNSSVPVVVSGLTSGVAAVSAGRYHACALSAAGGVQCWGGNGDGQLGVGTGLPSLVPVGVVGLSSGVTSIATGRYHTCALSVTGGIECWGRNRDGQLGTGTTTIQLAPVDVVSLTTGVAALTAGYTHSCAVTTAGGAQCWGGNVSASIYGTTSGQLGDGTSTNRSSPVLVTGLGSGISAIGAGTGHTCAVTNAGGVKCWGGNGFGQLGDGTTSGSLVPVDVTGLSSGISEVAAGSSHTCALTTTGGVKCWGWNSSGQLGDGTTTDSPVPVDVSGLSSGVAAIAIGSNHSCALTSAGGVKCWGSDTTVSSVVPVDITGLTTGVVEIGSGSYHACALTAAGGVKCWGDNRSGGLGDGTTINNATPSDVTGLTAGIATIGVGSFHSCAVTTAGGAKCWGRNGIGAVGAGTTDSITTPVDVVGLTSGVLDIVGGSDHTCALTTAVGVKCWGNNQMGSVGDGSTLPYAPSEVVGFTGTPPAPVPALGTWALLALGSLLVAAYAVARRAPRQRASA